MNKQINISVAFSLDLTKILNELVKNNTYRRILTYRIC